MLQRKALAALRNWHQNKTKQALLVTGARQVGKTFLIRKFAQAHYQYVVELNLVEQPAVKRSLSQAQGADDLLFRISVAAKSPLVPGQTLVFIDEAQECPEIFTQIKFLVDKGGYDYVLSGSLLGFALESARSLPIGYLTEVEMFPLDFEEFCLANGLDGGVFERLRENLASLQPVEDFLHERLTNLFHRYLLVGGMPDAVNAYLQTNLLDQVRVVQNDIRNYYRRDISKYAPKDRRLVIQNIYDLIPSELLGKNKRFKLSTIANVKRFAQVDQEFLWLTKAGVAHAAYNLTQPARPLLLNESHSLFKLFCSDVGLLTSTYLKESTLDILDGSSRINWGGTYENAVAQELVAHGFDLRYFTKHGVGELDFVVERKGGAIIAFEVKSSANYLTHRALDNALDIKNYDITEAYVLGETNIACKRRVTLLPLYMAALFVN